MSWYVTECRSCKASVIWTVTTGSKNMLVDADPVSDGTFALEPRLGSNAPRAVPVQPLIHPPGERYRSHFASCPDADQWRKNRSKGG